MGERPDDCTEVGYARSAGILLPQAYEEVLKRVLDKWRTEDTTKLPPYSQFSGSLKNVSNDSRTRVMNRYCSFICQ